MKTIYSDFPVIYTEDEVLVSLDGHQMLTEIGIKDLTVVNSHKDAIGEVKARQYALGVLDVNLGGTSSFDIARELHRQGASVIFTTGYNATELPEEFAWAEVLEKPVVFASLKSAVEAIASSLTDKRQVRAHAG